MPLFPIVSRPLLALLPAFLALLSACFNFDPFNFYLIILHPSHGDALNLVLPLASRFVASLVSSGGCCAVGLGPWAASEPSPATAAFPFHACAGVPFLLCMLKRQAQRKQKRRG
ncbi:hypothetical protein JB92DRAFT_3007659 [Gautieria morchelliformis]|nr:hypothetical protein JB92DRAFT_3007659 [Gautieria morchelliformis]